MSRSLYCQTSANELLGCFLPILVSMLESSSSSGGDFCLVEEAVGTAVRQLRSLSLSQALSASVEFARHDYTCPDCGVRLTGWGSTPRSIMTSQGEANLALPRFRCCSCGRTFNPLADGNGLVSTRFTLAAKQRIVEEATDAAYAGVSERLPELGIDVSAKEVDRLVCQTAEWHRAEQASEIAWHRSEARRELAACLFADDGDDHRPRPKAETTVGLYDWKGWEGEEYAQVSVDGGMVRSPVVGPDGKLEWFEERSGLIRPLNNDSRARPYHTAGVQSLDDVFVQLEAVLRQRPECVKKLIFISDDGNGLQSRADASFPNAIHAVDIYHAGQHVGQAADAAWGQASASARRYKLNARSMLLEYHGAQRLIREFAAVLRQAKAIDRDALRTALRYLWRNRHRMKYAQWQSQGLPVGSGAMESAVKQVCVTRLRRSGMMWTKQGADNMLRVRSAMLSGMIPQLFGRKHAEHRRIMDRFFKHRTYSLAA